MKGCLFCDTSVAVCHGDGLATLRMGDRERHVEAAHLRELAYDMLEAAALLSSPEPDSPKTLAQEIIDEHRAALKRAEQELAPAKDGAS